jgi:hypothetical protein
VVLRKQPDLKLQKRYASKQDGEQGERRRTT